MARSLLTLWIVVTAVFFVLRASGDPIYSVFSLGTPESTLDVFRVKWGIDKSFIEQYLIYISDIFHGDFGTSFFDGRQAWDIVMERLPKTLLLGGTTFSVSVIAGVTLGAIAALKRGTFWDRGIMTAAVASFSMPSYFLALLLILLFSLQLRWLPTAGASTWQHLILPATTLGLTLAGSIARFTRSAMLEVLRQSYMRTARAKGAPKFRQIAWHALPNAAIPTVTVIGFQLGWLIGGSVVIETVFAWPGAGRLFITAVGVRDFAVVQLFILMVASTVILANLLVDILYGYLDPRISITSDKN
ncbi:ABC transporter, permease protein 1 (cluster 5, nickel/peptides/opines) [hydrothermal vent metagenome]|uniref:ABC transporter, permease protein 1 (Cluster 5, nickel/peptides/opines) n=1 Tax=hydrothermal vent metagenome TaxID=652676 RepID=A0A3B0TSH9_9ZZZZ